MALKKLRIVHLADIRGIGGLQAAVRELGSAQARQGHEVHLMLPASIPGGTQEECFTSLPLHAWKPHALAGFDVVHTHGRFGLANGTWRGGYHRPSIIHTHHGTIFGIYLALRWFPNFLGLHGLAPIRLMWNEAQCGRRADHVIAVSPKARREVRRFYLNRKREITVIPNGYSPSGGSPPSRSSLRHSLGLPENDFLFLFVGRPDPVKDLESVAQAFKALRQKRSDLCLVIAPRHTLNEPGVLTVEVSPSEVSNLYHACDAMINASRYEGYSLAVHEALANGIPVILSDMTGNAAYTRDGTDALIFHRGGRGPAHRHLRAAMEKLLDDPRLRSDLSENALRTFAPMTWDWVAEQTEEVYREALTGR